MSELLNKQIRFTADMALLLTTIFNAGYRVKFAEGFVYENRKGVGEFGYGPFRDRVHMNGSLHYAGLAMDLSIFDLDGRYMSLNPRDYVGSVGQARLNKHRQAYEKFGEFWESLNPDNRWGGRFNDANHFSVAHEGKA